ncbi:MAG: hypothetical protein KA767_14530 [Saprospiraceae bacterium]|nr:hypothetical protein [Saprospiraceae bacterium]
MLKYIGMLGMFLFVMSCKSKENKVQDLHTEVMEIHDEVMPKMTNLHSSRKELEIALKQGADSIKVFELLEKVDAADEAMMVWMDEFDMPDSTVDEAIVLDYLQAEKVRILKVKTDIESCVGSVSEFAAKYITTSLDSLRQ